MLMIEHVTMMNSHAMLVLHCCEIELEIGQRKVRNWKWEFW